jgi:U4/U6 small nuclear ribonucleoprotein PRP3
LLLARQRPPPPEVEWWDVPFLPNETYDDVESGEAERKIRGRDSPITLYIQHPIPIPAPKDRHKVEEKPLMLTKKEMKKMRRQRRAAELREHQDRVRMGLLPPPPPKGTCSISLPHRVFGIYEFLFAVKLSNMMRVLTQEHVSDPTKIEAKVRREMMARKLGHERSNAEHKLTDEARREKAEKKKEADESRGIHAAAFK